MTLFEFLKDFKETPPKKKLKLPKKFERLFGETLSDVASLKPTLGLTWKIGLTKRDGNVWLNNGWPEFVHHFSLDKGRSLFFRYEGNSEFSVSIFDNRKSIGQIYGKKPKITGSDETEVKTNARRGSSGNPIEISGSWFSCSDDEVSLPVPPCTSTRKRTRANTRCNGKMPVNDSSNEDSIGSNAASINIPKLFPCGKLGGGRDKKTRERTQSPKMNTKTKKEALPKNVGHTKSGNPSVVVMMQPSAVDYPFRMHLPIAFWREYLNCRAGNVVLFGSEGGVWIVNLKIKIDGGYQKPKLLGNPWKKFIEDNNLTVGDSCTFELINRTKISFKVTISRATNDSDSQQSSDCDTEDTNDSENFMPTRRRVKSRQSKSEEIESEQGFWKLESEDQTSDQNRYKSRSTMPFFTATVRKLPTYYVNIPTSFGSLHLEQKSHTVMLEVGERLWPVKALVCKNRYFLSRGFLVFLQQNYLRQGDQCKFELKDGNKGVLRVTIFRCNDGL